MRKPFWGRHVWARGSVARSSGHVTDEVITAAIENQVYNSDDNSYRDGE